MSNKKSTIDTLVAKLCEKSLNAACKAYQDELRVDGGWAGIYFSSDENESHFSAVMGALIRQELSTRGVDKHYERFVASRTFYENLHDSPVGSSLGNDDPIAGWVYLDGAYIEETDKYCLPMQNNEICSENLADLEPELFLFCLSEGYFDFNQAEYDKFVSTRKWSEDVEGSDDPAQAQCGFEYAAGIMRSYIIRNLGGWSVPTAGSPTLEFTKLADAERALFQWLKDEGVL